MSRIASYPIELPKSVEFSRQGQEVRVKGPLGELSMALHPSVEMKTTKACFPFSATQAEIPRWPERCALDQ